MNRAKKPMSSYIEMFRTILAVFISLLIVFAIILLVSEEPLSALKDFVIGPLTSLRRFGNVIEAMIPLIFTGMSVIILFKPGLFNLSMEGAFFLGAVAACASALTIKAPGIFGVIIAMVIASLVGAVTTSVPGVLQVKAHANVLVTSLMLNYICLFLGSFIITTFLYDPTQNVNYSYKFPENIVLPTLIPGTRVSTGLIIATITVVAVWTLMNKTSFGFKATLVGQNYNMASYTGTNAERTILLTQAVGGMLAGLGAAVELFSMYRRFQYSSLPGYGWDGVLIAIVAKQKIQYVPLAAFFLAYLRIGADIMSRNSDIPFEIVKIIQAVMVLLISATAILSGWRKRLVIKEARAAENVNSAKTAE